MNDPTKYFDGTLRHLWLDYCAKKEEIEALKDRIKADEQLMHEALEMMLAAIKAGDWKVDGACDPDMVINNLSYRLQYPHLGCTAWPECDLSPGKCELREGK